ncbi:probable G-protein coupled receptor 158 [Agrilus planipennis]|uniref:Probable G-protein coupled receptor 158 n=1 Tax=Agrilus planipennis TaxID=224129 RepID=A0A1W4XE98_AGRPL|nr:probable G-protein coupled receptor 158 [Agrilus planipennis]
MVLAVFVYMAAYVAISLNFHYENFDLLYKGVISDNMNYVACKPLWWDYVTEIGELSILVFGIHLSHACRNAKTQFNMVYAHLTVLELRSIGTRTKRLQERGSCPRVRERTTTYICS